MNPSNDRKSAIKKLRLLSFSTKHSIESFRKNLDNEFSVPTLPNHVECSEHSYAGIKADLLMPEVYSLRRIILYIHGGSFVGGSRSAWQSFCASLASSSSCRVVVPDFRLPPSFAFPAGLEDVQNVFRSVFTEEQVAISLDSLDAKKADKPEIIIASDGSGASIALALVLSLRERYRACISRVILFSPWLNMSPSSPLIATKKMHDEILSGDCIRRSADMYTYTSNLENHLVSPIFASDDELKDFPSVYIQMGEKEILKDDAIKFAERLKSVGCECDLDIEKDMMFMYQMADEYLSESHLAIERIGRMIALRKERIDEVTQTRVLPLESSLNADA